MNRESLFAGILIGLGAYGFLSLGGIPGAVIFAFGLMSVIYFAVPLYTGKAGVINDIWALTKIWFFNVVCWACWPGIWAEKRRRGRKPSSPAVWLSARCGPSCVRSAAA